MAFFEDQVTRCAFGADEMIIQHLDRNGSIVLMRDARSFANPTDLYDVGSISFLNVFGAHERFKEDLELAIFTRPQSLCFPA